jgi:hypothetical protein
MYQNKVVFRSKTCPDRIGVHDCWRKFCIWILQKRIRSTALSCCIFLSLKFVSSEDLRPQGSEGVKYSLFLTDRGQTSSLPFAAFIVPQVQSLHILRINFLHSICSVDRATVTVKNMQGREVEWLFATAEGRRQLCETASAQRLVVVHLGRNAAFSTLEAIQDELSSHVLEFAPPDLPSGYKVCKNIGMFPL